LGGIGESKIQLAERMIAIRRPTKSLKAVAAAVVALLVAVGLTGAQSEKEGKIGPTFPPASGGLKTLSGTVWLPEGNPAAIAEVGWASPKFYVQVGEGRLLTATGQINYAQTDSHGAFTMSVEDAADVLYAANEAGFAIVPHGVWSNGIRILLQPWGKVEGVMRLNDRPAANQQIELVQDGDHLWSGRTFASTTVTDNEGRFSFARVPSGFFSLCRLLHVGNGSWACDPTYFSVKSGETTQVAWGGKGRPVVGRFVLNGAADRLPTNSTFSVSIRTPFMAPEGLSYEEMSKWRKSDAGRRAWETFHWYGTYTGGDGAFEVDDVLPGAYEITFTGEGPFTQTNGILELNSQSRQIVVPQLADPNYCEPFDLGEINSAYSTVQLKPPNAEPPN
jgi:hypothetical protein